MTKQGSFKRVVRRRAEETGQRYTEALTDLEGLNTRVFHKATSEGVLAHLTSHYGINTVSATPTGLHSELVFRVERQDGEPWIARVFAAARTRVQVDGDAAILRVLAKHDFPAERLAVDDAVSEFDGQRVLVTRFVDGGPPPSGSDGFALEADLIGRLHALPVDASVSRAGGAFGHDPSREGGPRQDLVAALLFLDAIETKVTPAHRGQFERLRDQVKAADDGHDLPESLVHGDLVDHVVWNEAGPVAIHWSGSGRGARLAELAFLLWTTGGDQANVDAVMGAYRRHVQLLDAELDRLASVMTLRPLYLTCWYYWQSVATGYQPTGDEGWWNYINADYLDSVATATREALRR